MDGTYLAWIDFGAYVKAEVIRDIFENQCGIAPSFGEWFGGKSYATFCAAQFSHQPRKY